MAFQSLKFDIHEISKYTGQVIDWGLTALNIPEVWKKTKGKNILIGVLDTGICIKHVDLLDCYIDSKDFTNSPCGVNDVNGHGTFVAGILAAVDNNTGIIGIASESKLVIAKGLNDSGTASIKSICEALEWLIEKNCNIINMSFGSQLDFPELKTLIDQGVSKGIIFVSAAGNNGPYEDSVDYPAQYEDVISVASINATYDVPKSCSKGVRIDVYAPGENILSCFPVNTYARASGTSFSTPFVTGLIALSLSFSGTFCKEKLYIKEEGNHVHGWRIINPKQLLDTKL